ncbi:hypothetical protein Bhyg_17685, partial [Pseudolycoriella hygida]
MNLISALSWMICMSLCKCIENHSYMEPPKILMNGDQELLDQVSLNPQSNFSMRCVSEYEITWIPFKGFTGSHEIEYSERDSQYISEIHLFKVTRHYVGFFFCVANVSQYDYDNTMKFNAELEMSSGHIER